MRHRFIIYSVISIAFFSGIFLYPLDPDTNLEFLRYDHWKIKDGLPLNGTTSIYQSSDRYLWLGTQAGLVRYNGREFKVFSRDNVPEMAFQFVITITEDHERNIWFGTIGGGVYRIKNGKFESFNIEDGLPGNIVRRMLTAEDGKIWITTDDGLCYWNGEKFDGKDILPAKVKAVRTITQVSNNRFLAGTEKGLYEIIEDESGYTSNLLGFEAEDINEVVRESAGTLWLGTRLNGLIKVNGKNIKRYSTKNGMPSNSIISLRMDSNGALWAGTFSAGLVRIYKGKLSYLNKSNGLTSNSISDIYEDHEGSIWISTNTGGINRLADVRIITYTEKNGLASNSVFGVFQDSKARIWIGSLDSGITLIDGNRFYRYGKDDGLPSNCVYAFDEDADGNIWIGTIKGIVRYNALYRSFESGFPGVGNNSFRSIHVDSKNRLWAGSSLGVLYRFSGEKFEPVRNYNYRIQYIHSEPDGTLWLSTRGAGIIRFKNSKSEFFNTQSGLSSDFIVTFHKDSKGNLWFGTNGGGANIYHNEKFYQITPEEGLPDRVIYNITEDNYGNIWMGSNRGIFMLPKDSIRDFLAGKTKSIEAITYGLEDGMLSVECNGGNQPSVWKTLDGRLWFPTTKGVAVINPEKLKTLRNPPPIIVEDVKINGKNYYPDGKLNIPPGQGDLEISYAGITFIDPKRINYRYKLTGYDKDWHEVGNRLTAYYTNIPPGTYTFEVQSGNRKLRWSESTASFQFRLKPHFYQTTLFYILCFILISLLCVPGYKLRIRSLQKRKNELKKQVEERTQELKKINEELDSKVKERTRELEETNKHLIHAAQIKSQILANVSHELRTPLSAILGYAEIMKFHDLERERQDHYIEIINKQGEYLLSLVRSLLDVEAMSSGELALNLSRANPNDIIEEEIDKYSKRVKQRRGTIEIKPDKGINEIYLDVEKFRLMIRNIIDNAYKFSNKKPQIYITTSKAKHEIIVKIKDNGIGIDPKDIPSATDPFFQADASSTRTYGGTGLGLFISKSFAELHMGQLSIKSEKNKGTEIRVSIPVNLKPLEESEERPMRSINVKGKSVLVVDDNKDVAEIIKVMAASGYKVYSAENGKEALDLIRKKKPDLIFLDMAMPVLNGYETARLIKEDDNLEDIPIIALSARTMPDEVRKALQAGCAEFIAKPFDVDQINDALTRYITGKL